MSVQFAVPSTVVPAGATFDPLRDTAATLGDWIARRTGAYRRTSWGMFFVGFASFALIYCVQPVLPAFAADFGLTPAESSLALSLTTGFLAASILLSGVVSQSLGRRGVIMGSMALGAVLNVAAGLSPSWHGLLVARALEGFVLGGVPAVAMAYLAEEIEPKSLGRAMGLYIAGSAFGGLMGRVGMGLLAELTSWRGALVVLGLIGLACAAVAFRLLPASRHFERRRGFEPSHHLAIWAGHMRNPALIALFGVGFVLTGVYVTIYNYIGFRLAQAPFSLSGTAISTVFLCVVFGIVSSSVSGALAERFGKARLLGGGFAIIVAGVALTAFSALAPVVAGVACVTAGFFISHSIASSWIGPLAGTAKGHAASLYLTSYYVGSSVIGSASGWFWQHGGWDAVACVTGAMSVAGLVLAMTATRFVRIRRSAN
ncbi:MFS transporter [Methylopila sp. M107]|uniref:MFS transporter n=1 Tax=Methylopila sp. M107 TaxID=1101190 RepID=UPI000363F006|nr:MFS transporter [Methylopila sp. M107]